MGEKIYILIAGVNGAGKSTLYSDIGDQLNFCSWERIQKLQRVNMDEIVKEIGDWRNADDVVKAGKMSIRQIKSYFEKGNSFCQETTLCGRDILKNINIAKTKGYKVGILYVGLENVEIAKERVKERVKKGGHGISDEDIERRYEKSLQNLNEVLIQCDSVVFIDNTYDFNPFAIYDGNDLKLLCEQKDVPNWFENHICIPEKERKIDPLFTETKKRDKNKLPNGPSGHDGR